MTVQTPASGLHCGGGVWQVPLVHTSGEQQLALVVQVPPFAPHGGGGWQVPPALVPDVGATGGDALGTQVRPVQQMLVFVGSQAPPGGMHAGTQSSLLWAASSSKSPG